MIRPCLRFISSFSVWLEVADLHIFSPGIHADQARGMEHLDAEHEHVLHALFCQRLALGSGEIRKTSLQIGDGPGAVFLSKWLQTAPMSLAVRRFRSTGNQCIAIDVTRRPR